MKRLPLAIIEISWFIFAFCVIGALFAIVAALGTFYDFAASLIESRSLRFAFWRLGIMKSCPYCGGEMRQHGYEPEARYTCHTEGCKFNED